MENVKLRPVTEADLPDYVRWFNDPEVTQFTRINAGAVTMEKEREWFAGISSEGFRGKQWAIDAEGRHIGTCSINWDEQKQDGSFGIIIGDKTAWNKGCGTAALQETLRIGFGEMGLHRIHLTVFPKNERGLRCYQKCGFRQEGLERQAYLKGGQWHDIIRMALLREEWEEIYRPPADDGNIRIRAFTLSDYEQVIALWRKVGFHPRAGDSGEALCYKITHDQGPFVVAKLKESIVGTAMGSWDGRWAWINRVAAAPEHRRQGLGRRLVAEVESRLGALGAQRIYLIAEVDNASARRFYEGLGYNVREDVFVMSKDLGGKEECGHES